MKNRQPEHRRPPTSASRAQVSRRRFLGGYAMAAGRLVLGPSILAACGSDGGSGTALKLARPDKPVTLPSVGDAVAAGKAHEGGTLQILNYCLLYTSPRPRD